MSLHEWKSVTCTYPDLEARLADLQAQGFAIHSVAMDAATCTLQVWQDDGSGYGSVRPKTYNVWVILATRDLPAPSGEASEPGSEANGTNPNPHPLKGSP